MIAKEKWNVLVKEFNAYKSAKEDVVQRLWENIFSEVFGYSRLKGEIVSHRSMQIGSTNRVVPDIIITDKDLCKDIFLIELKQPLYVFEQKYKWQLFSYMKLFDVNVGVVICNEIRLFVFDASESEISMRIPFEYDNENGCKFVELFTRGNFDEENIRQFIEEDIAKRSQIDEKNILIDKIVKDILSCPFEEMVKKYYSSVYANEDIESALKMLMFTVRPIARNDINGGEGKRHLQTNEFRDYLSQKKYAENTIGSYLSAIKSICDIECVSYDELVMDIEQYVEDYGFNGKKNYLGQKGHGTWRNALNRLLDFTYEK